MPTATFYPSVLSQPATPEGFFIPNAADATDWTNIGQGATDASLTTDVGSLNPALNSLPPVPVPVDAQLESKFAYTPLVVATLSVQSKMARGINLLRTTDNAPISTVIPATATAITNVIANFRFADTSYGIDNSGGSGAAVYGVEMQQRNASGVIGANAEVYNLFDYAGATLYCYYVPNPIVFGVLPTVAQLRSTDYGVNFRAKASDALEVTAYMGINGISLTITWTEPEASNRVRRQLTRLPDGRIAAARARIR
jgi:hypothetical protein